MPNEESDSALWILVWLFGFALRLSVVRIGVARQLRFPAQLVFSRGGSRVAWFGCMYYLPASCAPGVGAVIVRHAWTDQAGQDVVRSRYREFHNLFWDIFDRGEARK